MRATIRIGLLALSLVVALIPAVAVAGPQVLSWDPVATATSYGVEQSIDAGSTNHAPATGLTVTVTRAIDAGAFAAGTLSAVTEVAFGIYAVDWGAGDLNGDNITFRATAAASDDLLVTIETDP